MSHVALSAVMIITECKLRLALYGQSSA